MDYLRKKRGFSWVLGDRLLGLGVGNKKGQVSALVCKNLTCKLLLMSVGSLFAIFCLLLGRTRTVSSGYVFLFLCLGLDLPVILLWLGASAGE